MMKQIALVSGFAALSACSGGLEVPDLRGAGEGLFGGDSDAAADRDDNASGRQDDTERHRHVHPAGSQSGMMDLNLQFILI